MGSNLYFAGIRELAIQHVAQKATLSRSQAHGPNDGFLHSSGHVWQHRLGDESAASLEHPSIAQTVSLHSWIERSML